MRECVEERGGRGVGGGGVVRGTNGGGKVGERGGGGKL